MGHEHDEQQRMSKKEVREERIKNLNAWVEAFGPSVDRAVMGAIQTYKDRGPFTLTDKGEALVKGAELIGASLRYGAKGDPLDKFLARREGQAAAAQASAVIEKLERKYSQTM